MERATRELERLRKIILRARTKGLLSSFARNVRKAHPSELERSIFLARYQLHRLLEIDRGERGAERVVTPYQLGQAAVENVHPQWARDATTHAHVVRSARTFEMIEHPQPHLRHGEREHDRRTRARQACEQRAALIEAQNGVSAHVA